MLKGHVHLHLHLGSFLPRHMTRSVKELFGSVAILGFASAAVSIFEPIFLYTLGYSVAQIVWFFIIVYGLYLVLLPIAAKLTLRIGTERMMLVGSLVLIPYYLGLFAVEHVPALFYAAAVILAVQKMFYWVAYHTDFAKNATDGEVGREIGEISLIITIVTILGPIIGGTIISMFGFLPLFVVVVVLILVSNIPLLSSKEAPIRGNINYGTVFAKIVSKEHRRSTLSFMGYGEDFVFLVIWPVFIYAALQDVFGVGAVITVSAFLTSLMLLYFGKITDVRNKMTLLRRGSVVVAIAWLVRTFVMGAVQMVFAETLYRIGRGAVDLPLTSEVYSRAKSSNVVEGVTMFEMSLVIGKLVAMGVILVLLTVVDNPWSVAFVVAALMSPLFALLRERKTPLQKLFS